MMRQIAGVFAAAIGLAFASAAAALPTLEIKNAVAQVIIVPEARDDIQVDVVRPNGRLPIHVSSFAGRTYVDGGLWNRVGDCHDANGQPSVHVWGVGDVGPNDIPKLVIHTPTDVRINSGGAIWGQIGRSQTLELGNAGCGRWLVSNVAGRMKLSQAGSGEIRTGLAASAELYGAGSGAIMTREVSGPVTAMNVGSGDIEVAGVNGALSAKIAGSGRVKISSGHASAMNASIAGSGDIELDGIADSLKVSVVGSGDVRVQKVNGPVNQAVIGSGQVRIGS